MPPKLPSWRYACRFRTLYRAISNLLISRGARLRLPNGGSRISKIREKRHACCIYVAEVIAINCESIPGVR